MSDELIVGFNGGEVSRNIESRVDLPLYKKSCSILENFDAQPEGGARNRAGTKFISKTKGSLAAGDSTAHLIEFSYADDQSYIFEFGDLYIRIYRVQDQSFVQDLVSPYTAEEAKTIQFERSYDVMWLVHPDHPDQTLTRTTLTTFTIADTAYDFPPMLDENITSTTITPSGTTGSITLTASADTFEAGHVGSYWLIKQDRTGSLQEDITNGVSGNLFAAFSHWRVETGGNWNGQVRVEQSIDGGTTWETIVILADTSGSAAQRNIIYDSEIRAPANALLRVEGGASSCSGNIRVIDSYQYGLVEITAYSSATSVTATVLSTLLSTDATKYWNEGAFSDVRGYPRTITLFEGRRWLSGTYAEPNMVWGSTTEDFYNYFIGTLADESIRRAPPVNGFSAWLDAKEQLFLCTTNEMITITGLTSSQGLTPDNFKFNIQSGFGSEHLQNELTNDVILYVEKGRKKLRELIYARDELNFQSNDVSALAKHISRKGIGTVALQKLPDQKLLCVLDDGELGVFTYERTEEVLAWSRYVTDGLYRSVAVAQNGDDDSVWYVIERDGEFFIEVQKDRDSDTYWFLDSASSFDYGSCVTPDSMAIGSAPDYEMTVTKTAHGLTTGQFVRFSNSYGLDYLKETVFQVDKTDDDNFVLNAKDGSSINWNEFAPIPASYGGDYCVVSNIVDGLDHLEDETVRAICDNSVSGDYVVSGGEIEMNTYCSNAIAGLPYNSTLSPLPIELVVSGITVGRNKSVCDIVIKVKDSIGGSVGSNLDKLEPLKNRYLSDEIGEQLDLLNEDIRSYSLDSYEILKRIYVRQDLPLPFEVLSISMDVRKKAR